MAEIKNQDGQVGSPSSVPIPDPTQLTTMQIDRAIDCLRQIMEMRLVGMDRDRDQLRLDAQHITTIVDEKVQHIHALQDEKFHSIDVQFKERDVRTDQAFEGSKKAIDAALQAAKEAAAAIDEKTAHLQQLHDEKFRSIQIQFTERDVRTEKTSMDSKLAVDAALQAAKEAVAKSETATVKQIDQQGMLIQTSHGTLDGKIQTSHVTLDDKIQSSHATEDGKIEDLKHRLSLIEGKGVGQSTAVATQQTSSSLLVSIVAVAIALAGLIVVLIKM